MLFPDIQHMLAISVQTWPTQRTSHQRSRTSVRQVLRSTRRPASTLTTRGHSRVPRAALGAISNLLCHCFLRLWLPGLFALQRYCPCYHRAPKVQGRLACKKTTFRHKICASPGGHHQPFGEHARQAQRRMVCRKRCLHKPSHSRAWNLQGPDALELLRVEPSLQ